MQKMSKINYWLLKSEPEVYSIDDLKKDKKACWEGVRNYQARNFIKSMKKGDLGFFYHSNANPSGIAGIIKICKEAYPDYFAFDKKSKYYDEKSSPDNPRWFMPDVCFVKKFKNIIPLNLLKEDKNLKGMELFKKGSRLSIQPVSEKHFKYICKHYAQTQF